MNEVLRDIYYMISSSTIISRTLRSVLSKVGKTSTPYGIATNSRMEKMLTKKLNHLSNMNSLANTKDQEAIALSHTWPAVFILLSFSLNTHQRKFKDCLIQYFKPPKFVALRPHLNWIQAVIFSSLH